MSEPAIQFSIVIPCYNEAGNLPLLLDSFREIWPGEAGAELVLVDNGSTDNSASILRHLLSQPKYSFARVVKVEKNQGYGFGIMAGLRAAHGSILGFSHADLQTSPADLFRGLREFQKHGSRALVKGRRGRRPWKDTFVTHVMTALASAVFFDRLVDINAQPKVFSRQLLNRFMSPPNGIEFDLYVVCQARRAGLPIVTIPVQFGPRATGESKWAAGFISRYRTILQTIGYMFRLRWGNTQ